LTVIPRHVHMCVTLFSVNISVLHRSPVCFSYILLGSVEQTEHHSQRKHPDIVSVLDAKNFPVVCRSMHVSGVW